MVAAPQRIIAIGGMFQAADKSPELEASLLPPTEDLARLTSEKLGNQVSITHMGAQPSLNLHGAASAHYSLPRAYSVQVTSPVDDADLLDALAYALRNIRLPEGTSLDLTVALLNDDGKPIDSRHATTMGR